ncbi:MAG: TolC family protein [Candidatus Adiutrix sp.]|jgi:outer membrane protein TolC|nr:TolC family protein [Candidatus Adiutrix sp.]
MRVLRFTMAVLLLGPLLTGCARVSRPERNLAERLEYDAVVQARYQLDPEWWKQYDDPRLNQVVEVALANNIDLAKAAVSVNRALYQAKLLAADLVPGFSGGLDASARKNIRTGAPSSRSVGGDLTLSYELDLWQKIADAASAARWEYEASVEDLENARLALINSVVDAYCQLAYLNEAISAGQLNLKNLRAIESTVGAKHEAGKVAAVEPAQARQAVLNAENSLTDYRVQHKNAEQTLKDLLNLKPHQPLDLEGQTLANLRPPRLDLNIPLSVLANRPDLRAAEYRLEKAFKQVEEAEKGWLPNLSLSSAISSAGQAFNTAWEAPVAGGALSINLPFLDWSRVLYNLRISETDFESTRLDFEKTLTTALNEVDAYYFRYEKSRQTLGNSRRKYASDARISQYHQDRYEAGAGELSDWLEALNAANSSRLSALNALYQTIQYENMVYKAMAGRYVDLARGQP